MSNPILIRLSFVLCVLLQGVASAQNFVIDASNASPEESRRYLAFAERYRRDLSEFWFGKEMPRWYEPIPVKLTTGVNGDGGSTSMLFQGGETQFVETVWKGSNRGLIRDVIPHEVDHAVRHSVVRRRWPRWLDEGCATLFESEESHKAYREICRQTLAAGRTLGSLDELDYTGSADAQYAQGFTLVEYLLTLRDHRYLILFARDGRSVAEKLPEFYGVSESQLLRDWGRWITTRETECVHVACYGHCSGPKRGQVVPRGVPVGPNVLTVVHPRWFCRPCWDFDRRLGRDKRFREAIGPVRVVFEDQVPEVREHIHTMQNGGFPFFYFGNDYRRGIVGYTDDLIQRLHAIRPAVPDISKPAPPQAVVPQPMPLPSVPEVSPETPPLSRTTPVEPVLPAEPIGNTKAEAKSTAEEWLNSQPESTPVDVAPPPGTVGSEQQAGPLVKEPAPPRNLGIAEQSRDPAPAPPEARPSRFADLVKSGGRWLLAGVVNRFLPEAGAMLGFGVGTGGVGLAAVAAGFAARWIWRRWSARKKKTQRRSVKDKPGSPRFSGDTTPKNVPEATPLPGRDVTELIEIRELRKDFGHDVLLDSARGNIAGDEIDQIADGHIKASPEVVSAFREVRMRVNERLNRIAPHSVPEE